MINKEITVNEIKSDQNEMYKNFLQIGLINNEDSFRISPNDDLQTNFPTNGTKDSFTIGAYVENKLAGIVSFTRDGNDREKLRHKGILYRMYVSAAYRGLGIAKILIENVIIRAKQLENMEQINLTVISNNIKAKNIYINFGFETFSTEKNAIKWKNNYFDEESMVLFLKK